MSDEPRDEVAESPEPEESFGEADEDVVPEMDVRAEPAGAPVAPPLGVRERLSLLLFTLREKMLQRSRLRRKANLTLTALFLFSAMGAVFTPCYLWVSAAREPGRAPAYHSFWAVLYLVALALWPFVLSVTSYFWTTFAQMYMRGLPTVEGLLATPEYDDLAPHVNLDVLTDDWSVLSLMKNLFVVDVGFSLARFFVLAAVMLIPTLVQGFMSVLVVVLLKQAGNLFLAAGLAVLYLVFFIFTVLKNAAFHEALKREAG